MRILIVGSGGREHALAHHLGTVEGNDVICSPGNPGTERIGRNVSIAVDDIAGLLDFARTEGCDLTVVGPEIPLVMGIVDQFRLAKLPIVGPTAAAARLEGSKAFSKQFMQQHNIPTAAFRNFSRGQLNEALSYLEVTGAPVVVKASGLAAGKGAVVCSSMDEAVETVRSMLTENTFGAASDQIVIEEFMDGEEASVFALCSGTDFVLLSTAQDHKRIGENDTGPNTGGMGAYAPAPVVTKAVLAAVQERIIEPTLNGMRADGCPYDGFLYIGLMIASDGSARVVEYNCRLGDPETQVVLPLIRSSLTELLVASASNALGGKTVELSDECAAVVVLASEGYPGGYKKGLRISGLEKVSSLQSAFVYHAGTSIDSGDIVTNGGRVLGVTGTGSGLKAALDRAYAAVDVIDFDGMYFRRDIGSKGLVRRPALEEQDSGTP